METFNFLLFPFLACLLLIAIHAYFGIHILERGIIFVDLALAQFIGIGIALSFLLGEEKSVPLSLLFAFLGAFILSLSKKAARHVNIEAFIGILYIFAFSASILILDKSPHGMEEFKAIMNGNIIWVTPKEVFSTFLVYGGVGVLHFLLRKQFFALSFEGKGGIPLEFLFFFELCHCPRKIGSNGRNPASFFVSYHSRPDWAAVFSGAGKDALGRMVDWSRGQHGGNFFIV